MSGQVKFFVGLHHPSDAHKGFDCCMVSVNALRNRKSDFGVSEWILDSGAFTELTRHGDHRYSPVEYAAQVRRWSRCGKLVAAVSQDYMCEPFVLAKTGLSKEEHQRRTISRYLTIASFVDGAAYVMPVLQGYEPWEYVEHVRQYGRLLGQGQWVGVGSVCKRNARVESVERVLMAVKDERPDLRLHGFGLKITALESSVVRDCLHSADSMAWSFAARYEGRDPHDHREAHQYVAKVNGQTIVERSFQRTLWN